MSPLHGYDTSAHGPSACNQISNLLSGKWRSLPSCARTRNEFFGGEIGSGLIDIISWDIRVHLPGEDECNLALAQAAFV